MVQSFWDPKRQLPGYHTSAGTTQMINPYHQDPPIKMTGTPSFFDDHKSTFCLATTLAFFMASVISFGFYSGSKMMYTDDKTDTTALSFGIIFAALAAISFVAYKKVFKKEIEEDRERDGLLR